MSEGVVRKDRALNVYIRIPLRSHAGVLTARIDFLIPEKTHKGSCRGAASFLLSTSRLSSNSAGGK